MKKISKIFHLADLHIRNYIRHNEYREVLNNVYDYIRKNKDENSVIVLAGDIVHAKNDMSPEAAEMQCELYLSCSNLCTTILITGNHDCNLNNSNRMDALTPFVNALNLPNLHYWKDTGVYKLGGISFSVMSVFTSVEDYILAEDIDAEYKVALFHGAIDGSTTDIGFKIQNKNMPVKIFDGFDLVLLGDIHSHDQCLQVYHPGYEGIKYPLIKYPGSLICQNHGEGLKHGILVWDIKSRTAKFQRIENEYGYYTIEISDGRITTKNWISEIPKKVRLRILYKDTDPGDLKLLISEIGIECNIIELTQRNVIERVVEYVGSDKLSHENILDSEYQNQLIENYLSKNYTLTDEVLNRIYDLNRDTNSKLDTANVNHNIIWKPIKFEFSNMFSYGEDNIIDFTDMVGLNGIFAPNASGKSSILSAMVFCLFDKCDRTNKAGDIINNQRDSFVCKFEFEMDSNRYFIERKAYVRRVDKRGNKQVSCIVDFWMETPEGNTINLNGEQRDDTNKIIRSHIGTYDDCILTTMLLQANTEEFINSSQRSRKEILSRFLDIGIFEYLYSIAKDDIRATEVEIKVLERSDFGEKLSEAKKELETLNARYNKLNTLKSNLANALESNNAKIIKLTGELQVIDDTLNIDELTANKERLDKEKLENEIEQTELQSTLKKLDDEIKIINDELSDFDIVEIEKEYSERQSKCFQLDKLEKEYGKFKVQLAGWNKQIEHLATHEYDPQCKYCVKNPFVLSAKEAQQRIVETAELKNKFIGDIEVIQDYLDGDISHTQLEFYKKKTSILAKLLNDLELNSSKLESVNHKFDSLEREISNTISKIKTVMGYENIFKHNKLIEDEIKKLTDIKVSYGGKFKITDGEILNISGEIKINERIVDESEAGIQSLSDLHRIYSAYEYYLIAIKHDGLPYYLIEQLIPNLENAVNNILVHIVDFTVNLFADGKNISAYIDYGDGRRWAIEMTSGMERFITSLAFRVAMINSSNLPRPNFMCIDEGFGVLDSENLNSLHRLFSYLNSQFDFVLCISHLSTMRDLVDDLIEIQKTNGFSKIRHSKYLTIYDKEKEKQS